MDLATIELKLPETTRRSELNLRGQRGVETRSREARCTAQP